MDYEITFDTQVILPMDSKSSKIIENNESYVVNVTPMQILEHSCEYFGSSFDGRREGTKKLLGITHKSPIIVEESRKIIFFPTTSPDRNDCIWINLEKISRYYKSSQKKSIIEFKNGDIIEFDVSIGSLTNQILRASRLKYILEENKRTEISKIVLNDTIMISSNKVLKYLTIHSNTKLNKERKEQALRNIVVNRIHKVCEDPSTQVDAQLPISMDESRAAGEKNQSANKTKTMN